MTESEVEPVPQQPQYTTQDKMFQLYQILDNVLEEYKNKRFLDQDYKNQERMRMDEIYPILCLLIKNV